MLTCHIPLERKITDELLRETLKLHRMQINKIGSFLKWLGPENKKINWYLNAALVARGYMHKSPEVSQISRQRISRGSALLQFPPVSSSVLLAEKW